MSSLPKSGVGGRTAVPFFHNDLLDQLDFDVLLCVLLPYCDVPSLVQLDIVFRGNMRGKYLWQSALLPSTWRTFDSWRGHCHGSSLWISERKVPITSLIFTDKRFTVMASTFRGTSFPALATVNLSCPDSDTPRVQALNSLLLDDGIQSYEDMSEEMICEKMQNMVIVTENDMLDHTAILYLVAACHSTLTDLNLNNCEEIGPGSLGLILRECTSLRHFTMEDVNHDRNEMFAHDMEQFKHAVQLETINLGNGKYCAGEVNIRDVCLPSLVHLNLAGCQVSGNMMLHLTTCRNLETLRFMHHHTLIDSHVPIIVACCQQLRTIFLWNCEGITTLGLIYLLELPNIEEINVSCCEEVCWDGPLWKDLPPSSPSTITHVVMFRCRPLTSEGIDNMIRYCPRLVSLKIGRRFDVEDVFLADDLREQLLQGLPDLLLQEKE